MLRLSQAPNKARSQAAICRCWAETPFVSPISFEIEPHGVRQFTVDAQLQFHFITPSQRLLVKRGERFKIFSHKAHRRIPF